jgi:hypothetical protein
VESGVGVDGAVGVPATVGIACVVACAGLAVVGAAGVDTAADGEVTTVEVAVCLLPPHATSARSANAIGGPMITQRKEVQTVIP